MSVSSTGDSSCQNVSLLPTGVVVVAETCLLITAILTLESCDDAQETLSRQLPRTFLSVMGDGTQDEVQIAPSLCRYTPCEQLWGEETVLVFSLLQ